MPHNGHRARNKRRRPPTEAERRIAAAEFDDIRGAGAAQRLLDDRSMNPRDDVAARWHMSECAVSEWTWRIAGKRFVAYRKHIRNRSDGVRLRPTAGRPQNPPITEEALREAAGNLSSRRAIAAYFGVDTKTVKKEARAANPPIPLPKGRPGRGSFLPFVLKDSPRPWLR